MAFDAKQFGTAVKTLRVNSGLTQTELGQKMGFTQAAVVMIEQGKRGVSMETIDKLGKAFDVPAECLSILAFRPISDAKGIADLSQSLQRLIVALVDARRSTTKVSERPSSSSSVRLKTTKVANAAKVRKGLATARALAACK